jgi:hypothetical protein
MSPLGQWEENSEEQSKQPGEKVLERNLLTNRFKGFKPMKELPFQQPGQ